MNRAGLCIQMLNLLKARGKMNTNELAQALETNPRNIREFKKELVVAGYNIEFIRGKYGGYRLVDQMVPVRKLNNAEIVALKEARLLLNSHPEFEARKDFNNAMDLLISDAKNHETISSLYMTQAYVPLAEDEKQWLETTKKAIAKNQMLKISYQSKKEDEPVTFEIDPYCILHYEQAYYVVAYSHRRNDFRTYRFSNQRMKDCTLSSHRFVRDEDFDLNQWNHKTNAFSGEWVEFEVRVSKEQERIFMESFWGSDLQWVKEDKQWVYYRFCNDSKYILFKQLFAFGKGIQLMAPQKYADEFQTLLQNILNQYKER